MLSTNPRGFSKYVALSSGLKGVKNLLAHRDEEVIVFTTRASTPTLTNSLRAFIVMELRTLFLERGLQVLLTRAFIDLLESFNHRRS